jgi:hypothetical protein
LNQAIASIAFVSDTFSRSSDPDDPRTFRFKYNHRCPLFISAVASDDTDLFLTLFPKQNERPAALEDIKQSPLVSFSSNPLTVEPDRPGDATITEISFFPVSRGRAKRAWHSVGIRITRARRRGVTDQASLRAIVVVEK